MKKNCSFPSGQTGAKVNYNNKCCSPIFVFIDFAGNIDINFIDYDFFIFCDRSNSKGYSTSKRSDN